MFDPSQLQLGAQVVLLRELAALVAAGIGPDTSGPAAAEVLDELIAAGRQLDLATCKSIERVDRTGIFGQDGSRSATAYVRRAANETPAWASRRVHLGRALVDSLPATRSAWENGLVGMAQADIICRAVKSLEADLAAEIERVLAKVAGEVSTNELNGLADLIVAQAAPEDAAERDRRNYERQTLSLSKTIDGQWKLDGRFDAEAGAVIRQVLDTFTRQPEPFVGPNGEPNELTPAGFRRAQALAEICRQAAGHAEDCQSGGGRPTIVVTADKDDLIHGIGVGDIEGGSVLPAAAIRRLACDAGIIASVLGADSSTLDFGRRTRLIATGLRIHLVSRDGGCVFPGCDALPAWCQVHHLVHWGHKGRTKPSNLVLLCHHHHHSCHEGGWTTSGTANDLLFHPPDGGAPRAAERQGIRQQSSILLRC